jgi:L-methionine (R)-S-oxide reductase
MLYDDKQTIHLNINLPIESKHEHYKLLSEQALSLFRDERDFLANMANFSALIYHNLPDLNWAGFYLLQGDELVLGPFQGKVACVRITLGKGVCGTTAEKRQTVRVDNVHEFAGHIACDEASRSEIVIPLIKEGVLFGVFDMDSPEFNRFDQADQDGLEILVSNFIQSTDIPLSD